MEDEVSAIGTVANPPEHTHNLLPTLPKRGFSRIISEPLNPLSENFFREEICFVNYGL